MTPTGHEVATPRVTVDIPHDWLVVDPPDGVALVAADPMRRAGIRSNLVVVVTPAPGPATDAAIDEHLASVIEELDDDGVDLLDVVADHLDGDVPPEPTQRIIMLRHFGELTAEVCQQHRWIGDRILVTTVTVPSGELTPDETDVLLTCLDSVSVGTA